MRLLASEKLKVCLRLCVSVCLCWGEGNVKLRYDDQTFTVHAEVQRLHRVSTVKYIIAPTRTAENLILKHLIFKLQGTKCRKMVSKIQNKYF